MSNFGYDVQKVVERKPEGALEEQGYALFRRLSDKNPPYFRRVVRTTGDVTSHKDQEVFFDYYQLGLLIKEDVAKKPGTLVGTLTSSPLLQQVPISLEEGYTRGFMNLDNQELETASKQIFKALQGL